MKKKISGKFLLIRYFLLFLFVSGCSGVRGLKPEIYLINTNTPTRTIAFQTTPLVSNTITPTLSPVSFTYKKTCLPSIPISEMADMTGGLIISEVELNAQKEKVMLIDVSNNTITNMFGKNDKVNGISVSPDNTWITYALISSAQATDSYKLVFRNMVTSDVIEIPWNHSWSLSGIMGWNNQQDILIQTNTQDTKSAVKFNFFTKEALSIPIIFPNQIIKWQHRNLFLAKYNPSFDYVVYPSSLGGEDGYLLINTITSEKISFIPSPTLMTFSSPTWNHSGNGFLVSQKTFNENYAFELIYGTISGEVIQITSLSDIMDAFYIRDMIWSPNDDYVALVINDVTDINNQSEKLFILDMVNREILDFCVNVDYSNWDGEFSDNNSPVWSPDGRILAAEEQIHLGENKVFFINISKMKVAVMENKKILGWVNIAK